MNKFKQQKSILKPASIDGFVPKSRLIDAAGPMSNKSNKDSERQSASGSNNTMEGVVSSNVLLGARTRNRPNLDNLSAITPQSIDMDTIDLDMDTIQTPKKSPKNRNIKKIIKRTVLASALLVMIVAGTVFGKGYLKIRGVFKGGGIGALALKKNVDPTQLKGEGDGRVNILLLGKAGPGFDGPDLTDTILIASIDPISKQASILSIPRDLYVSAGGSRTKINSVYSNGKERAAYQGGNKDTIEKAGTDAIKAEITEVAGIPIQYYMMVDFQAFQEAITAVGGVQLNVTSPVYERMAFQGKPYILDVKNGVQQFDGLKALMYSRSRYTSSRGDFDRAERQRAVLVALKDRVLTVGTFSNPVKLNDLINAFGNHVTTDLTQGELLRVYELGKSINSSEIASLSLVDPPHNYLTTDYRDGLSIVMPRAGLDQYTEIKSFVRNQLKDGYIKNENASIAILNGTTVAGLATKTADELKSYGYNVTVVDSAPTQTYKQTVMVDQRSGEKKYTKRYLEQRLKLTSITTLPDQTISQPAADFVIILGQNETTRN